MFIVHLMILLTTSITNSLKIESKHDVIPYEDVVATIDSFSDDGVTSYSQLLFDVDRKQLIVGARDNIYRLRLNDLKKIEVAQWSVSEKKLNDCLNKGQTLNNCHNYIKVLLSAGKRIFACGTGAFSPECTWRELENANNVTETIDDNISKAMCPYSPVFNSTAMMTLNGQYFVGTPVDFSGVEPTIFRHLGGLPHLRTKPYNTGSLNGAQFVGSFETEMYAYFIFRENALEYTNCGKKIYSRIGRVCKTDKGRITLKNTWTSFVKARLNCSLSGDYPFYYDEVQGVTYLQSEGLLYATFTTPNNGIAGSAVCSYNLSAINTAFNGPFKSKENTSEWTRVTPIQGQYPGRCENQLSFDSSKYQLMDNGIQPMTLDPLYHRYLETLTHIAIAVVPTKQYVSMKVLFVATTKGTVKKITILPKSMITCTLEEWDIFPEGFNFQILTMHYSSESIYMGTNNGVLKILVQHCNRYKSKEACVNAMDPYCGWNENMYRCQTPPDGDVTSSSWQQNITQCPDRSKPVDGNWSEWLEWVQCFQNVHGQDSNVPCLCTTRKCTNPNPKNGGADCKGHAIKVTNCTVHGQWSSWSDWSACSQSCGLAVKTRTRTCGNPAPAFGGRVCVGNDKEEMLCDSNPPCLSTDVKPSWSDWGPWTNCSATSGVGYRSRMRFCYYPSPHSTEHECTGTPIEYELCNGNPVMKKKWTPWTSNWDGSIAKRYRVTCTMIPSEQTIVNIMVDKVENKVCHQDGECNIESELLLWETAWSEWSLWSKCSADCGGGEQIRNRTCENSTRENCTGKSKETRACNTHKCKGKWTNTIVISNCSVNCGEGNRTRIRKCLYNGEPAEGCEGDSVFWEPCYEVCNRGWAIWSEWSDCNENGQKNRTRKCDTKNCPEPLVETVQCDDKTAESSLLPWALSFLAGVSLTCAAFYVWRTWRKWHRPPNTIHRVVPAKPNPYVMVPLTGLRAAVTPSFARPASADHCDTLPKLFSEPTDYETATIKRNSRGLVSGGRTRSNRPELEQDKFF